MNRVIKNVLVGSALTLVLVVGAAVAAIELRWTRTFDRPDPPIRASSDSVVVARGRYLVFGPAACAYCHVPRSEWARLDAGETPPLSGNHVFPLPFGEFYSPNLTPDPNTGIGRRTDGALARILRYGVRPDGRAAFPLMEFQDLSDEDLAAVVSYLRSQPAVRNEVSDHRLNTLGKALMAFFIEPAGPTTASIRVSPVGPSVERGRYLANSVSSCASCHTDRDRGSGSLVGPMFAGGQRLDVAADETKVFVAPNLTPDRATSPIGQWTEDTFVVRFRQGETIPGTPMPWGAFARMTEDDMRSLFRYLRTLQPVAHATGPVIQEKN